MGTAELFHLTDEKSIDLLTPALFQTLIQGPGCGCAGLCFNGALYLSSIVFPLLWLSLKDFVCVRARVCVCEREANGIALTYWEPYILGLLTNKLVNYGALNMCL